MLALYSGNLRLIARPSWQIRLDEVRASAASLAATVVSLRIN
jgi:hypothetical protein